MYTVVGSECIITLFERIKTDWCKSLYCIALYPCIKKCKDRLYFYLCMSCIVSLPEWHNTVLASYCSWSTICFMWDGDVYVDQNSVPCWPYVIVKAYLMLVLKRHIIMQHVPSIPYPSCGQEYNPSVLLCWVQVMPTMLKIQMQEVQYT